MDNVADSFRVTFAKSTKHISHMILSLHKSKTQHFVIFHRKNFLLLNSCNFVYHIFGLGIRITVFLIKARQVNLSLEIPLFYIKMSIRTLPTMWWASDAQTPLSSVTSSIDSIKFKCDVWWCHQRCIWYYAVTYWPSNLQIWQLKNDYSIF